MSLAWTLAGPLVGLAPVCWASADGIHSLDLMCGIGAQLAIAPPAPTAADPVQVTAAGEWPDFCVPVYEAHEVAGGVIRIDATVPSIDACAAVITPWQFPVELGLMAPGSYQVQLYLSGPFGQPVRLCAKADLVVRPVPAWRLFLPLISKLEPVPGPAVAPPVDQPVAGSLARDPG